MTTNPTEGSGERVSEIMRVVHDLESWRAVEKNFGSRKLIDDAAKRLREIDEQHRRQSQGAGEWVPWKPGDALPESGEYWTARHPHPMMQAHGENLFDARHTNNFNGVIAYWSIPLPPPYSAQPSQGECEHD